MKSGQHRFSKGKSYLINSASFYNETVALGDERRIMDVVYLNFSKVLDTISHKILTDTLLMYRMGEQRGGLETGRMAEHRGWCQWCKVYLEASN